MFIYLPLIVVLVVAVALVVVNPLLRVASGFTSKTVCSGVFLSKREESSVLSQDVLAPGHPVLKFISVSTDRSLARVNSSVLGLPWTSSTAVFQPDSGCTLIARGSNIIDFQPDPTNAVAQDLSELWPEGEMVQTTGSTRQNQLIDDAMSVPGTRAIVVVRKGRIVLESYAEGFNSETALLGWSLTKTVTALLIGIAIDDGLLSLEDDHLFSEWNEDERRFITVRQLLHMESGLEFNESADGVSDATRMLFLEPDMSRFAVNKPLVNKPGDVFSYSSGNTHLLIRYLKQKLASNRTLQEYVKAKLFSLLNIKSGAFEADAAGNLVGSAFLYLTARDWSKFALLVINRGQWSGQSVVSSEWIDFISQSSPGSAGEYGGHIWLRGQSGDAGFNLPKDAIWFLGHDGQSIAVIPSEELIVVRLGLTPGEESFKPQVLVQGLVEPI